MLRIRYQRRITFIRIHFLLLSTIHPVTCPLFNLLMTRSRISRREFRQMMLCFYGPYPRVRSNMMIMAKLYVSINFCHPINCIFLVRVSINVVGINSIDIRNVSVMMRIRTFGITFFTFMDASRAGRIHVSPFMQNTRVSCGLFLLRFSRMTINDLIRFGRIRLVTTFIARRSRLPTVQFIAINRSMQDTPICVPLEDRFIISRRLIIR